MIVHGPVIEQRLTEVAPGRWRIVTIHEAEARDDEGPGHA